MKYADAILFDNKSEKKKLTEKIEKLSVRGYEMEEAEIQTNIVLRRILILFESILYSANLFTLKHLLIAVENINAKFIESIRLKVFGISEHQSDDYYLKMLGYTIKHDSEKTVATNNDDTTKNFNLCNSTQRRAFYDDFLWKVYDKVLKY